MQVARRRMPWNLTRDDNDTRRLNAPNSRRRALGRLGHGLGRQLDLAAGLLDRGDRRRRGARDLHFDLGLDLALPRRRTPSDGFLNSPAACMAAASISLSASSFLSSIAFCSEPRLTTCHAFWFGGRKPRLGMRR